MLVFLEICAFAPHFELSVLAVGRSQSQVIRREEDPFILRCTSAFSLV